MRIAWASKGPPPLMMVSGDNRFLRRRAVQHLVNQAYKAGYEGNFAGSDDEVVESISMGGVFGQPTLIVANPVDVAVETATTLIKDQPPKVGILMGSILSALVGYAILRFTPLHEKHDEIEAQEAAEQPPSPSLKRHTCLALG